ncbi:MAG: radical SAM protein [Patescibacteria group bacterium]|jgi:MoaA/NifB/PqqE/SkfB family radical SAM enzyme
MFNKHKTIKYGKIALAKLKNIFVGNIYLRTGLFMPRPTKLYYLMSNKCNFRCQMCPQWKIGEGENISGYISENRIKEIIKEMAKLKIFEFGISGGEPLIFKDKLLRLLKYANEQGLYTHFATNGSLLTEEFLEKYDNFGGGHISLSLDAGEILHDSLRGFPGAYKNAMAVMKISSGNKYKNINLKINITLTNENLDEISPLLMKAKEIGAMVFIQPYDAYDYGNKNIDYKENNYPLWVKKENYFKLKKLISKLLEFKRKNPEILLNDEKHLKVFYSYFTDSNYSAKCYAAIDQVTIDPFGNVILCKFGKIVNLRDTSLKDYIYSKKRKDIVKASLQCGEGCLLGCMFKPSLIDLIRHGSKQFFKLIK